MYDVQLPTIVLHCHSFYLISLPLVCESKVLGLTIRFLPRDAKYGPVSVCPSQAGTVSKQLNV